jgi:hypothetical protein
VRDHMLTAVMQTKYRATIAEESNSSRTTGNADVEFAGSCLGSGRRQRFALRYADPKRSGRQTEMSALALRPRTHSAASRPVSGPSV